tara:strand:+ start:24 stop:704 length:681 start_codon:yes stop_codon:yes gene_type:complete
MFVTVFGQKGGVAKTCTSVHIAASWSLKQKRVVLVDADRNRSATAYGARGLLPCPVVPIEAAAKATRLAEIVVTDGQASSNDDEIKNLVEGADFILLPTTTQSRSIELTVEMSQMLRKYKVPYAALLVKVDARKGASADQASELLQQFDIKVLKARIPLLSAFEHAETEGVTVDQAIDNRGRANPRRMTGWSAYEDACQEIEDLYNEHSDASQIVSPIVSPIEWAA